MFLLTTSNLLTTYYSYNNRRARATAERPPSAGDPLQLHTSFQINFFLSTQKIYKTLHTTHLNNKSYLYILNPLPPPSPTNNHVPFPVSGFFPWKWVRGRDFTLGGSFFSSLLTKYMLSIHPHLKGGRILLQGWIFLSGGRFHFVLTIEFEH